jgi:hypothetical protein
VPLLDGDLLLEPGGGSRIARLKMTPGERSKEGRMSHAATDSNTNFIGAAERTNLTVSSGRGVVASIFVNGSLVMDTQVNNLQGNTGTLLSLSGVVTVAHAGQHTFDLQAYIFNMPSAGIHHRSITVVELG